MNSGHATSQILVALAGHFKSSLHNQRLELLLARETLYTLDEILVAIAVAGNQLPNHGDGAKRPALVNGVEQGVVHLGELHAGKDAAGLEHAVRLPQGGGYVGKVADAKGDRVQVERVVGDAGGEDLGVGFEEGQRRLVRGRERERALAADLEHVWVDVGYRDVDVGVGVLLGGVLEHAEGNVAGATGDVEDLLGLAEGGRRAGVQGGYKVVPIGK